MGIIFSVCPRLSSDRVYKSLFHTVLKCIARPPVLFMTIYSASPLDSKEIKPVNPKGIKPEYSLKGLMLKFACLEPLLHKRSHGNEKPRQ